MVTSVNLVTVSVEANELLRLVLVDSAQGSLTFKQILAEFALNEARKNMELILAELTELSPNVDVYVMGYYFAYPHVRDSQKSGTAKQLDRLNEILERSAEKAGATFVSVDQSFGDDAVDKVPNAADVHPNAAGYQAMANAFFGEYQKTWTVEDFELPPPNPLTFEQIMEAQEQEGDAGQEEESSEAEETAQRPSNHSPTGYLALREAVPFI